MEIIKIIDHINKVLIDKNLYYLSPTNLKEEKKRFFLKTHYNPKFRYKKIRFNTKKIKDEIKHLLKYDKKYSKIINDAAKRYLLFLKLIENREKKDFTKYSIRLYNTPKKKELDYAKKIISQKMLPEKISKKFDSYHVKDIFDNLLKKYDWKIILNNNLQSKMKISPSKKTLFINKSAQFTEKQIKRLEFHEIKTHIKRESNNLKIPKIIRRCFNYIETEEGLAVKMEEINDCLSKKQLKIYAARTLAVYYSLQESFYQVFKKIKGYGFDDNTAFEITTRAKRGLKDTSKKGSFTKDKIYLSGKIKIDEFQKKGGDIKDLFIGKISIKDIKKIKNQTLK